MNHSPAKIINEITNSCSLVQQKQQQQHQQQSSVKLLKLVKVTGEQTESITNSTSIKYIQTSLVPSTTSQNSDRANSFIIKKPPNSTTITKCQSPKISSYFIRDNSNGSVAKTDLYQPIIERPSILGNTRTTKVIVQSTTPSATITSANINTVFTKPTLTLPSRPNIAANAKLSTLKTKRIPLSQPNTTKAVSLKLKSPSVQTVSSTQLSSALTTPSPTYIPQLNCTEVVALQQSKRLPFSQTNSSDLSKQRPTNSWDCPATTTANAVTLISTYTRPSERISKSISSPSQSIPLETRYRNILENLLQLKNPFVQRTVTLAVQQKICNQTSDDLLNVIFKTLELILSSIDVKQTLVNVSTRWLMDPFFLCFILKLCALP